jgi:hypothetical protein
MEKFTHQQAAGKIAEKVKKFQLDQNEFVVLNV